MLLISLRGTGETDGYRCKVVGSVGGVEATGIGRCRSGCEVSWLECISVGLWLGRGSRIGALGDSG